VCFICIKGKCPLGKHQGGVVTGYAQEGAVAGYISYKGRGVQVHTGGRGRWIYIILSGVASYIFLDLVCLHSIGFWESSGYGDLLYTYRYTYRYKGILTGTGTEPYRLTKTQLY
jgi:hypothetical protein